MALTYTGHIVYPASCMPDPWSEGAVLIRRYNHPTEPTSWVNEQRILLCVSDLPSLAITPEGQWMLHFKFRDFHANDDGELGAVIKSASEQGASIILSNEDGSSVSELNAETLSDLSSIEKIGVQSYVKNPDDIDTRYFP